MNASTMTAESEQAFTSNQADACTYLVYESFGLTIDEATGKLYYQDTLVRCFDDIVPTENLSAKAIGYYEEAGTIDVRAVRDNNSSTSKVIGLEVLSSDEFSSRVIADPVKSSTTQASDLFLEYEKYGLTYDSGKEYLAYNGERARSFLDVRNSNGLDVSDKEFLGDTISHWDENGTIDVYAARDYVEQTVDGFGKLTGLRVATAEEYTENSQRYGTTNDRIETAK
jgi:hypothetical protein